MSENQKLPEAADAKLLRYDMNTRQVEKLNVVKKVNVEDLGLVEFLDERRKRLLRNVKERDMDYFTPAEVSNAIKDIEKLGLKDINVNNDPVSVKPPTIEIQIAK